MHLGIQVFHICNCGAAGICSFLSTSRCAELCSPFVDSMVPEDVARVYYILASYLCERHVTPLQAQQKSNHLTNFYLSYCRVIELNLTEQFLPIYLSIPMEFLCYQTKPQIT
jgi:hypothetical protein